MKNLVTPLIALLLSIPLHAATYTVKFVDDKGVAPQQKSPAWAKDQDCQLVSADDNTPILGNTVELHVGDHLIIETPKSNSLFFINYYAINKAALADISNLETIHLENANAAENCFTSIKILAVTPGIEDMNIHFTDKVNYFTAGYDPIGELVGNVTVRVVE